MTRCTTTSARCANAARERRERDASPTGQNALASASASKGGDGTLSSSAASERSVLAVSHSRARARARAQASPHPLYLCGVGVSFPRDTSSSCPFHKLQSYARAPGMQCRGNHYGNFSTVADAVAACSVDANCGGVYDHQCDSTAGDVYLCPKADAYEYEHIDSLSYSEPATANSPRGSCMCVLVSFSLRPAAES